MAALSICPDRLQAMAYGAAAMVDTIRPVRGFGTQCPLGRSAFLSRHSQSIFANRSLVLHGKTQRRVSVSAHLGMLPVHEIVHAHAELAQQVLTKLEGSFFTLADAAVSADAVLDATPVKQSDWLSGVTDSLEKILVFLKDGLSTLHVPYAYGFAIILLTVLVKAATYPLTKSQVESTVAMQNLQPKIKAIQSRYQGDQERIQLETARLYKQAGVNPLAGCFPTLATIPVFIGLYRALSNAANEGLLTDPFFWIPSLGGPTSISARQGGSGLSWLFPFENGVPPLGWQDTIAYLVLPVLLVGSQFISMQVMQPPQSTDPAQKNTQAILKFLPLMIGYFALSVPSGLSLYWLTNNILSTAQQVYLRKSKTPAVIDTQLGPPSGTATRIAPREVVAPTKQIASTSTAPKMSKEDRRGEKFRELKAKEAQRKAEREEAKRRAAEAKSQVVEAEEPKEQNGSAQLDVEESEGSEEELEVYKTGSDGSPVVSSVAKKGKRSRRSRAD